MEEQKKELEEKVKEDLEGGNVPCIDIYSQLRCKGCGSCSEFHDLRRTEYYIKNCSLSVVSNRLQGFGQRAGTRLYYRSSCSRHCHIPYRRQSSALIKESICWLFLQTLELPARLREFSTSSS